MKTESRLTAVRALRDEVRLKLHLAGMELKTEWTKLEEEADRLAATVAVVSEEVIADLERRMTELKTRLDAGRH